MRSLGVGFWLAARAVATVGFLVVPTMILQAPIEPVMGLVQKIFYFHVPCAIMMFLSTFVCAGGSIAYLFKGSERGDRLAAGGRRAGRAVRRLRADVAGRCGGARPGACGGSGTRA